MRHSYVTLLERLLRKPYAAQDGAYAEIAYDIIEFEDPESPMTIRADPTGRMMLVVEGPREIVQPIAEKAHDQISKLSVRPVL